MTEEERVEGAVRAVMAEVFDVPAEKLPAGATMDDVPGWDSLAHLKLITALEVRFGVSFTMQEIGELRDLRTIAGAVQRKTPALQG